MKFLRRSAHDISIVIPLPTLNQAILVYAALAACVAFFVASLYLTTNQHQGESDEHNRNTQVITTQPESANDHQRPENPAPYWYAPFVKQPAEWTLALLAALTLVGVWKQAIASAVSAEATARMVENADRPWVKVDVRLTSDSYAFDAEKGITLTAIYRMTNIGRSVAQNVWVDVVLTSQLGDFGKARERQKEILARHETVNANTNFGPMGYSLFPGDMVDQSLGISLTMSEIESKWTTGGAFLSQPFASRPVMPLLVGCVIYRFGLSSKWHHTCFAYEISVPIEGGQGTLAVMARRYDRVVLVQSPLFDVYDAN